MVLCHKRMPFECAIDCFTEISLIIMQASTRYKSITHYVTYKKMHVCLMKREMIWGHLLWGTRPVHLDVLLGNKCESNFRSYFFWKGPDLCLSVIEAFHSNPNLFTCKSTIDTQLHLYMYILSCASEAGSPANRRGSDKIWGQGSFGPSTGGQVIMAKYLYRINFKKKRTAHLIRLFY